MGSILSAEDSDYQSDNNTPSGSQINRQMVINNIGFNHDKRYNEQNISQISYMNQERRRVLQTMHNRRNLNGNDLILTNFPSLLDSDRICSICNKSVSADDLELHYVMCLTTPRVGFNDEILSSDQGECSICIENLKAGDKVARLPCLCIFHKECIKKWYKVKQTCPEHPTY